MKLFDIVLCIAELIFFLLLIAACVWAICDAVIRLC